MICWLKQWLRRALASLLTDSLLLLNRYLASLLFINRLLDTSDIQAQLFEKTVGSPMKIIVFEMKDELMRVRLEGRGNFDDRADAIKKRIDNYNEGTKPVIKAYSNLVKSVSCKGWLNFGLCSGIWQCVWGTRGSIFGENF